MVIFIYFRCIDISNGYLHINMFSDIKYIAPKIHIVALYQKVYCLALNCLICAENITPLLSILLTYIHCLRNLRILVLKSCSFNFYRLKRFI